MSTHKNTETGSQEHRYTVFTGAIRQEGVVSPPSTLAGLILG